MPALTFEERDKVATFSNYEEYLDSLITDVDRAYIGDEDVARFEHVAPDIHYYGYRGAHKKG